MPYVDTAILNVTEWLCRRLQVLTGRTNVWFALQLTNLSIIVYFVWAGVYFWRADAGERVAVGLFCAGLLYLLTQTVFKVPIEAYENSAYRRVAQGLRNPRRIRDLLLRISFLTLSLVLFWPVAFVYVQLRATIVVLGYSLIVLTTIVLYLLACDPLPPCAGKLKEWLGSLGFARAAPVESTQPSRADVRMRFGRHVDSLAEAGGPGTRGRWRLPRIRGDRAYRGRSQRRAARGRSGSRTMGHGRFVSRFRLPDDRGARRAHL